MGTTFDSTILDLRPSPWEPQNLYLVTRRGLWRSEDRGESFRRLPAPVLTPHGRARLRFDPSEPGRMFLAAGRRLLISQDFGGQWQDVSDRLAGWPLFFDVAPDPEAPDHIYAATPWGLYRTVLQEGATAVDAGSEPVVFGLDPSYPNPFNASTVIGYRLSENGGAEVQIYNALGQQVRTLVDGDQVAGQHVAIWDGRDAAGRRLASGVYVYRLTSAQGVLTRKMVLLR